MAKAIFVDTGNAKITEVEVHNTQDIHELLGGHLEMAHLWSESGNVMYVDEEGMLKNKPRFFFKYRTDQLLYGNAVIVGKELINEDYEYLGLADTVFEVQDIEMLVAFMRP